MPYEKIGKNEPVCIADEVPFEIPDSWEWVRLKNICNVVSARRVHQTDWKSEGVPFYRAREIGKLSKYGSVDNDLFISEELYQEFAKSGVPQKGDLMVTAVGTLGKTYIVKDTDRFYYKDASVICFENFGKLLPEFLQLIMMAPYMCSTIKEHSTGTTVGTITIVTANQYLIPVPPLEEQKRIVDKISEIFPIVHSYGDKEKALSTYNDDFPNQLKKSILQYAVQGKLVPQDPNDEPASVLLERIRAEKEQLIKAGKIKRDKHESVIIRRDNSFYEKIDGIERCIDDEIPFDVPENWAWCRLDNLCKSIADGDHQAPPQTQSGIPFLVISNVSTGTIDFANTRFVSIQYFDNLSDSRKASTGELLFTVTGSYGIVVPVTTMAKFCFQRHIALIKPLLNQEFLAIWLKTPLVYEQCSSVATGTAQKTVGLNSLKGLLIPVPPLAEQQRIVAKIDEILPALITL